jgi:hypothetical protein
MIKVGIGLMMLFLSFVGIGQDNIIKFNGERMFEYDLIQRHRYGINMYEKERIKKVKEIGFDGDTVVRTYNRKGNILSIESSKLHIYKTYMNDTLITYEKSINKKNTFESKFTYDSKLNILSIVKMKNQVVYQDVSVTYNEKNQRIQIIEKYGKNLKHESKILTIYEKDKKTKTEYYVDGKLKEIYNYSCDPSGSPEINKKEVVEKTFCTDKEYDENGFEVVSERITENGKIYLTKNFYQMKDSVRTQIRSERYNEKNKLVYIFYVYEGSGYQGIWFNDKGKVIYEYSCLSDAYKSIYSSHYRSHFSSMSSNISITYFNKEKLPYEESSRYNNRKPKRKRIFYEKY